MRAPPSPLCLRTPRHSHDGRKGRYGLRASPLCVPARPRRRCLPSAVRRVSRSRRPRSPTRRRERTGGRGLRRARAPRSRRHRRRSRPARGSPAPASSSAKEYGSVQPPARFELNPTVPAAASTAPGDPTPTPVSRSESTSAASAASSTVRAIATTTASAPPSVGVGRRARPRTSRSCSTIRTSIFVPPKSTPARMDPSLLGGQPSVRFRGLMRIYRHMRMVRLTRRGSARRARP